MGVRVDSNGGPQAPADFHLVEAHGAWCLTIYASERLKAALNAQPHQLDKTSFTVRVEPNLLPGGAFDVTVALASAGAGDERRDRKGALT